MTLRSLHTSLLAGAMLLPIVATVLVGLARLLAGLGDEAGALFVNRITLVVATLWVIDLIVLLLAGALRWELTRPEPDDFHDSGQL